MQFIVLLLIAIVVPWVNAGVDLPTRPFLYLCLFIASLSEALKLLKSKQAPATNTLLLLMLAGIGLGALSIIPISNARLPATSLELWSELAGKDIATLSLNPSATRIQISMLCAAAATLFLAAQIRISETQLRILSLTFLANGTAITLFAFVQRYSWNGALYWTFALPTNETTFGPIVYHNFAGAYLLICGVIGSVAAYRILRQQRSLYEIDALSVATMLMLATTLVGLFCSLSRGAILSGLAAAPIIGYCMMSRDIRWTRFGWYLPVIAMFAGVMFWFGMSDAVFDRLGTLTSGDVLQDQRLRHWKTALRAMPDFWLLGCGSGAYGQTVAMFETGEGTTMFFKNAHNQYLETLIANGAGGLLLLISSIVLAVRSSFQTSRSSNQIGRDVGYAGMFIALACAFHATVDYCLLCLAVSLPLAFIVGLATARPKTQATNNKQNLLGIGCIIAVLLSIGWATYDSATAAYVDITVKQVPWRSNQSAISQDKISKGINDMENAIAWRPDSLQGQEALGILHTINYRHQARAQLSQETQIPKTDPNLWEWTSTEVLHHRVHTLAQTGKGELINELRNDALINANLSPARSAFLSARNASPLWPNTHLRLEELAFLDADANLQSNENAKRIRRIAGRDARMLFECGSREFGAGRYESAYETWNQSLQASPSFIKSIIKLSLQHLTTEQALAKVVPHDAAVFLSMVDAIANDPSIPADENTVGAKASTLIVPIDSIPLEATQFHQQSRLHCLLGDNEQSVELLVRALQLKPSETAWRFELAKQLKTIGKLDEAESQAVRCVRQINRKEYRDFLSTLREGKREQQF